MRYKDYAMNDKFKGNSIALSVRPNTSPFSFPKKTDGI